MITCGIDGLSHGELQVGALLNDNISMLLLLHLSVLECSPALRPRLQSWAGDRLSFASPRDLFYDVQQGCDYGIPQRDETWVWAPPPAAALSALED